MDTEPKPGIYSPGDPTAQTDPRSMEPMLRYFVFDHLTSPYLRAVSERFHTLAIDLVQSLPRSPERTVALRKLLESKDAAVRAAVDEVKGDAS